MARDWLFLRLQIRVLVMGSFFKIVRTIEATRLFTLNLASKKPLDTLPAKQENLASISPTYWEEKKNNSITG